MNPRRGPGYWRRHQNCQHCGGSGGVSLGSENSLPFAATGGITTALKFAKSAKIAVQEIRLLTSDDAVITNGRVSVRETRVGSAISSTIAKGNTKVYKYLSITTQNILDSDVDSFTITFEVTVNWINEN
ncbi:MAG: hypothetical protein IIC64_16730, partial [SAR324 cluster bacterium]|nr:hypothetical protein [SAR324 cluster bacterium]